MGVGLKIHNLLEAVVSTLSTLSGEISFALMIDRTNVHR